ncbi:MAG: metal-sensing transcriptional repressor [Oscillospiraceae bacterium]|nr:metal-sensing transcriptional repressor [Oscillospiraceae bacterium]
MEQNHPQEQPQAQTHAGGHTHHHENTQYVINRLSRADGHLQHVRRMVESGRDCSEVLIQLSAVIGALTAVGRVIIKDHLDHCIVDAVEAGDMEALEAFKKAIDQYIK